MAIRVEVTYGDLDVMIHASGSYSPDVANDLTNRCYALFKASLADVAEVEADVPAAGE